MGMAFGGADGLICPDRPGLDTTTGTVYCQFRNTSSSGNLIRRDVQGIGRHWLLRMAGSGVVEFAVIYGTVPQIFSGTGNADGNWHYATGTWTGANGDIELWVDGTSQGTASAGTTETSSAADVTIGCTDTAGFGIYSEFYTGDVAECALWNVKLDNAEIIALHRGYSPLGIRLNSLQLHAPLVRSKTNDTVDAPMTSTGSPTATTHPRIIVPRGRRISYLPPQLRQLHYRFRTDGNAADAAPTWGAAEDAGGYDPGASNFRLRVSVANTGAAVGAQPFELYLSKNSGAYAPITTTSIGGVKSADASTDADETIIKIPRLTPGT